MPVVTAGNRLVRYRRDSAPDRGAAQLLKRLVSAAPTNAHGRHTAVDRIHGISESNSDESNRASSSVKRWEATLRKDSLLPKDNPHARSDPNECKHERRVVAAACLSRGTGLRAQSEAALVDEQRDVL